MAHKPERLRRSRPAGSTARACQLPAYGSSAAQLPVRESGSSPPPAMRMPGLDDHLVIPEAGEEYIDGVRYEVMGAEPEHADPSVSAGLRRSGVRGPGYIASTELLARSDQERK